MKLTNILLTKRNLDLIILGATGFTGRYIVEEVSRTLLKESSNAIKWGIAGRNSPKLHEVLKQTSLQTNRDLSHIPMIEVDINDSKSLIKMCERSDLIINCCGPYRFLGEAVIKACIDCGTHHIDVSGEPQFLETIQLKYNKLAIDKKVSIVGSCGFDSIPSDIGVQFLKNNFNGTLNSVETYLTINTGPDGTIANFATWDSLVNGFANRNQLSQLRRELYSNLFKSYQWKYRIKRKSIFINQFGYCVPFPGSDRSVVIRSQLHNYTNFDERPTQIETYFAVKDLKTLFGLFLVVLNVNLLAKHKEGIKLLLKYPHIFSCGVFKRQTQPTRESLLKNSFDLVLIGKGWHHKYIDPNFEPSFEPNKRVVAKISGGDLAYLDTSKIITQSALTLIQQFKHKTLPFGVLTPSVAFANTQIIDKLHKNGVKFEIIDK
jgi:short subunit dehydrogenase-like uncharacterized protein